MALEGQRLLDNGDLLDGEGRLAQAGYATTLCRRYDRAAIRAGSLRINDLTMNGEVTSIPEPATMSLLGLGALAMVLRRKIRK